MTSTGGVGAGGRVRRAWNGHPRASGAITTVIGSSVLAVVPLIVNRRFYYADDTQTASVGYWSHAGERLLSGRGLGWIDPALWVTGNNALDPQHGNWSPLVRAIELVAARAPDLADFATAVKVLLLVVASLGLFLLASTFVTPPWATVVGLLAPLNGVTVYIDATAWFPLLATFALLPYLWWALRRSTRISILPASAVAVLLAGLGFPQTILMAGLVALAVVVEGVLVRDRRLVVSAVLVGLVLIAASIAVFLPSALTAAVTQRDSSGVSNDEVLTAGLDFLSLAATPTGRPVSMWSWGTVAPVPLSYATWLLAVAPLLPWRAALSGRRAVWAVIALGGVVMLLLDGPSLIGPTRWPFRYFPLLVICLLLVLAVCLAETRRTGWRLGRLRLGISAVLVLGAAYTAFGNVPRDWWRAGIGTLVVLASIAALVLVVRRRRVGAATAVVVATLFVTVVQHVAYPMPATPDFGVPGQRAALARVQSAAVPPTVVAGTASLIGEGGADVLLGNSWLVGGSGQQNLYTSLGRKGFSDRFCIDYLGRTCPAYLTALFTPQPTTGELLVDELGANTVVLTPEVAAASSDLVAGLGPSDVPDGWHVAARRSGTVTWVRDAASACVDGGVAWSSRGVRVTQLTAADEVVRFRVDAVSGSGGRVGLCRLHWPGYTVDGGSRVLAIDGWMLGATISSAQVGSIVELRYRLPGGSAVLVSWGVAFGLMVAGVVWWALGRRRRASAESPGSLVAAGSGPEGR